MINVSTILSLIVVSHIMEHSNNRLIEVGQEIGKLCENGATKSPLK